MSMNPRARSFVSGKQRRAPMPVVLGTASTFQLSVDPNSTNVHGAAAAFVLYGLTKGFAARLAGSAYLSVVVLLKAAMEGQQNRLKVAPRIWWQVVNALTPKEIVVKGQTIKYDWNMGNFSINTTPGIGGVLLGAPQPSDTAGLFNISQAPVPIPTIEQATDEVSALFASYDKVHAMIPPVDDYIRDVGAFAYKVGIQDPSSSDIYTTQYGICASESPIRSWFGFCGFALQTGAALPFRIPRFFTGTNGSALQYIGLRLHYPKLMDRRFTMSRILFRTVDIGTVFTKHTKMLTEMKQKLNEAGRPQSTPAVDGLLPDAYYGYEGNDQVGPSIDFNLAVLHHLLNFSGAFIATSACWAGVVANGLSSISTGTNLILPGMNETFSDSAWIVESMSQLHVVFNPRNNMIHVPVPTISDEFISFARTAYANTYDVTLNPNYGGINLDLLNSTIGASTVQLMNGPSFFSDRTNCMNADNSYNMQNRQKSAVPLIANLRSAAAVRTRMLNSSFLKSDDTLRQYFAYRRIEKKRIEAFLEWRSKHRDGIKAPTRQSPITEGLPIAGDTYAMAPRSDYPDDQLVLPVALYESPDIALNHQRLISEDTNSKTVPNNVTQLYGIQQDGVASNYSSDPNNDAVTKVIAVSTSAVDPDEIIDALDPLVDMLPPRMRMIAKGAQAVAKKVAPAIQKAVQKGKERRQRRKEAKVSRQ